MLAIFGMGPCRVKDLKRIVKGWDEVRVYEVDPILKTLRDKKLIRNVRKGVIDATREGKKWCKLSLNAQRLIRENKECSST